VSEPVLVPLTAEDLDAPKWRGVVIGLSVRGLRVRLTASLGVKR